MQEFRQNMKYSIFTEPPEDFHATVEVAGCYCEFEHKILLVKRHPNTSQGNTWGMPAGKFEKGETERMAVIREVYEEVGLKIDDNGLEEVGRLYIRLPHVDYVYHMFYKRFTKEPSIILELNEHLESRWVTIAEAMLLPLVIGGKDALQAYERFLSKQLLNRQE